MNDYELYEIDDFLKDDFFIEWVFVPAPEHEEFWGQWLATHPHRADRVERARQILRSLTVVPAHARFSEADLSAMLSKVDEGMTAPRKKPLAIRLGWLAAAAVIVTAIGLVVFFYTAKPPAPKALIAKTNLSVTAVSDSVKTFNNSNTKKVVKLVDGSVVILTPNSEFAYGAGFNKKIREVTLNGEAFFEVTHNAEKPFVIYSHGIATKVLGTSFTIRSFAGEDQYHISVNTGKVQVREVATANSMSNSKTVVLLPNQELTYLRSVFSFKESSVAQPLPLSESEAIKSFSFSNTPFNDVMTKLEEVYNVKIHYDKEKYASFSITASLSALPLDEKIKMMCKVVNAECSYQDGEIFIK